MQRPVMDPTYLESPVMRRRRRSLSLAWVVPLVKSAFELLFSSPLRLARRRRGDYREPPFLTRLIRGAIYRLVFVPTVLAMVAAAIVFAATHPSMPPMDSDPRAHGVYYDPVSFVSTDGTRLQGWLVPVIDARKVLEKKEDLLHGKHPAVLLVHDFGQSPQQMLPLLAPLHDDGFVVLAVGLRGIGLGRAAGQTFGLNESNDVLASVDVLRRRPFVDPERIFIVGIGTGGNAALLAASHDPRIAGLATLDARGPDDVLFRLRPTTTELRWLGPFCKWTFELAYRVDIDELELNRFRSVLGTRPVIALSGAVDPAGTLSDPALQRVRTFLRTHSASAHQPLPARLLHTRAN